VLVMAATAMFLFGFPLRTYMAQRTQLARARDTALTLGAQNRTLRTEAAQLQTPAQIEALARQRYDLVLPGQEAYAILPAPTPAPAAAPTHGVTTRATRSTASHVPPVVHVVKKAAPAPAGFLSRFVHQLEFWS
jgi:hypothetical protein